MSRPKAGYFTKNGVRVPGVTTILSRFRESGGLIYWGWNIAHEPLMKARALLEQVRANDHGPLSDELHDEITDFIDLPLTEFDFRAKRDKAADAGTCAHEMVESYIRKREFDPTPYSSDVLAAATPAFGAFQEWAQQSNLEVLDTEVPLVSEAHRFGGTLDAMTIGNKLSLGDWKTSNRIYPEYLAQLAAYGLLWEEHNPGYPIDGGYHLLRFSKQEKPEDPVIFAHHFFSQLDLARAGFLAMRSLYDTMARLEKMVQ